MNLIDKISKVETLLARATNEGELQSALLAKQRLEERVHAQPIEYAIYLGNKWKKNLFIAICGKYQLRTYRYARQKYTTVMIRVSKALLDGLIWPEFNKYDRMFDELADDIMLELTSKIHKVNEGEETVISGRLPAAAKR